MPYIDLVFFCNGILMFLHEIGGIASADAIARGESGASFLFVAVGVFIEMIIVAKA